MLDKRETMFEAVVAQAYNSVVITNATFDDGGPHIEFANDAFCTMTGYRRDELIGRSPRILQGPATDAEVIDRLRHCLREGVYFEGQAVNYRKDGTPYHVMWNISPIRDDSGRILHFVSVQQDVTWRVEIERERDLMARALDSADEAITILDEHGDIVFANDALVHLTGRTLDDLIGASFREIVEEREEEALGAADPDAADTEPVGRSARIERRSGGVRRVAAMRRADGSTFAFEHSLSQIPGADGDPSHSVSVGTDVSARVDAEQRLRERAEKDALTGLFTRGAGAHHLQKLLSRARPGIEDLAVVLVDIDHFKEVNDRFGHPAGDRVLKNVASLLRSNLRDADVVARWGGEEFLILLSRCSMGTARMLAERIRASVAAAEDEEVGTLTASFGIACAKQDESPDEIIARADRALYDAKGSGRNRVRVAN